MIGPVRVCLGTTLQDFKRIISQRKMSVRGIKMKRCHAGYFNKMKVKVRVVLIAAVAAARGSSALIASRSF